MNACISLDDPRLTEAYMQCSGRFKRTLFSKRFTMFYHGVFSEEAIVKYFGAASLGIIERLGELKRACFSMEEMHEEGNLDEISERVRARLFERYPTISTELVSLLLHSFAYKWARRPREVGTVEIEEASARHSDLCEAYRLWHGYRPKRSWGRTKYVTALDSGGKLPVYRRFGQEAWALLAVLKRLQEDFFATDAPETIYDTAEMVEKAKDEFVEKHPDVSHHLVELISAYFWYCWK